MDNFGKLGIFGQFIILSIIILAIKFCRNSTDFEDANVVHLNCVESRVDTLLLSSLFKGGALVPLEATGHSLVGRVDKVYFCDTMVFVLDCHTAASLYVFNSRTGDFIRKIGSFGKGRGEYVNIYDFSVDEKRKEVYILVSRKRLLKFDLTGKYIGAIELPFYITNFEYFNDKFCFVRDSDGDDNLCITDMSFNVLSEYFPNSVYGNNYKIILHPLQKKTDGILYRRYLDDKIYEVDNNGGFTEKYCLYFGDKNIDLSDVKKVNKEQLKKKHSQSVGDVKYFVEGARYCYFVFYKKDHPFVGIYDRINDVTHICDYLNVTDGVLNQEYPLLEYVNTSGSLVGVAYAENINRLVNYGLLDGEKYSDESNPVLLIYK